MKQNLRHKRILITGASSGLGAALACSLAKREAVLVLGARRVGALKAVAAKCRALGAAGIFTGRLDVRSKASVRSFCAKALKGGGVDALVNNAGVHVFGRQDEISEGMLEQAWATNTLGAWRMVKALGPALKKSGGPIVQISSSLAWRSLPAAGAYAASKAALDRLSESLRDEGWPVLTVHPGVVDTPLREHSLGKGDKAQNHGSFLLESPQACAEKIAKAMERGRSRLITAPWIVRFLWKVLPAWSPALVDRVMKGKDARKTR